MNNFIPDENKFNLQPPPEWWLRKLHEFDPDLVVIPSRQNYLYRLAQKRPIRLTEKMTNDILWQQSDTQMLSRYGLVPVTTILATANWSNPDMWEALRQRAPHRMGGTEALIAKVEAQEVAEEAAKQAVLDDKQSIIAKDGWGLYRKKAGFRTSMYVPKTKSATPTESKAPAIIIAKS